MKENLKYMARLTAMAAGTWIKISGFFGSISVISVFLGLFFLLKDGSAGSSAHVSAAPALILMFLQKPIGSLLWILLLVCVYLVMVFCGKYVITKLINRIVQDKSETVILPVLDKIISKSKALQPELMKQGVDKTMLKVQMIHQIKETSENKWVKRILTFAFKKIALDDIDFNQDKIQIDELIKTKVTHLLYNITEASKTPFWIILGFQMISLLFMAYFPY
ncbi:hypothetical protein DBR32_11660 [Taibaiella sp. KBW10]|uniref:hypothetical protein n=1 Tax=Taibaiella sp. KBW10 TaxID=2153357 RepID=UPI000F59CBD2|nr:hypothetical protein [Taibaiella sp. KBW10]RQO30227.1 hypothetical protein DBR32_11660 [Taibaiella sp. KBW10]